MRAAYPNAQIFAHPNLTAAAAVQVARDNGLKLIQSARGNFYLSSAQSQEPAATGPGLHPVSPPAAAAEPDEPRAA